MDLPESVKKTRVKEKLERLFGNYRELFHEELSAQVLRDALMARIKEDKEALIKDLLNSKLRDAEVGLSTEDCFRGIQMMDILLKTTDIPLVEAVNAIIDPGIRKRGRPRKQE